MSSFLYLFTNPADKPISVGPCWSGSSDPDRQVRPHLGPHVPPNYQITFYPLEINNDMKIVRYCTPPVYKITLVSITYLVYSLNLSNLANLEGILPLKSHFHPRWKEWRKLPRVIEIYCFLLVISEKIWKENFVSFCFFAFSAWNFTADKSRKQQFCLKYPLQKWSFALTVISGPFKNNMHS
jgi:hypothetical protein